MFPAGQDSAGEAGTRTSPRSGKIVTGRGPAARLRPRPSRAEHADQPGRPAARTVSKPVGARSGALPQTMARAVRDHAAGMRTSRGHRLVA